ncbi:PREDICTED: calcitonin gene-related peptide type 1 receptor-like [Thamnophis sirtalis]|uniref:Calcitonin gene-related peptide type 1 receptor-like n=1 Tax=Thamnophis sirtalis TaxID=35019 RepID=A0A6I9YHE4_9SAUR|nr:PREDICTED: calcitonin gene-related peptide type 1 receptor-like [Thamnophis sirtalis]
MEMIRKAQFECYQKFIQVPVHENTGSYCNRTWDGWLCWDDTPAGVTVIQNCPSYYQEFNDQEEAIKICDEKGHWFVHPESNRQWTNYTLCTNIKWYEKSVWNAYYIAITGLSLSLVSLLISLGIFFCFNYATALTHLAGIAQQQPLIITPPVRAPLIPASTYAVARSMYFNDYCWYRTDTLLDYIITGSIFTVLSVNLLILIRIIHVLIKKSKTRLLRKSIQYLKAVRATFILAPLLGIQILFASLEPRERTSKEIHLYILDVCIYFQGLLVATIFCFFNGEVQSVLRRHWKQYRIQFEHSFAHSDGLRSASFTVSSSFTDGQSFNFNHDCPSEHLNGKSFSEMENGPFKPEKLYG